MRSRGEDRSPVSPVTGRAGRHRGGQPGLLESLTRRLRQLGQEAAETLALAMKAGDASWSARIKAADSVLGHLLRVSELLDLEERVAALEQAVGKERP